MNPQEIKAKFFHLLAENNTPHGIALGVAIGAFICTTPTYGFHTILFLTAAWLVPQANKAAIFLGTNISLPLTLPFITWGGYEIGRFVLHGNYPSLSEAYFRRLSHLSVVGILNEVKNLYVPLFVGSVILGLILAVILYIVVFALSKALKRRKDR